MVKLVTRYSFLILALTSSVAGFVLNFSSTQLASIAWSIGAAIGLVLSLRWLIAAIKEKYDSPNLAIELVEVANGYLFLTKKDFHSSINQLHLHRAKKKLSQAAIETLAIIAYRQPITKLEIEQIRGVNCDYTVQKLLEKELISLAGKADTVGKPILYQTSDLFMDYFGLKNIADLPQLKDFSTETNEIGEQQD